MRRAQGHVVLVYRLLGSEPRMTLEEKQDRELRGKFPEYWHSTRPQASMYGAKISTKC